MADESLFDLDTFTESRAQLSKTRAVARALGPGPVYQGVSKQIRWLTASGAEGRTAAGEPREPVIDATEYAGVIAAARQVAKSVDHATGHNLTGWRANGRDSAPLIERLEALLLLLGGTLEATDEFQQLLDDLGANDPATTNG